ncbi:MAG: hypothetical protein MK078_09285 [Crocinitomicaceae bacterium]|nr:hypothetical protein [Crocinitomicaceae bacterium]
MKSISFKRKGDSYLRYMDEKEIQKQKSPFNWDRFIYIALLVVLAFFIGRFMLNHYFYIEGNGQVLFENVDIRHTDDIRILEFAIEEGQDVKIGDTLFTYFLDDDLFGNGGGGGSNSVTIGGKSKPDSWIERELYNLRKNVALNNARIKDDKKLLALYEEDLERVRNEVILDAVSHTNLENLEYQISKLESAININESENSVMYRQIKYLEGLIVDEQDLDVTIEQNSTGGGGGNNTFGLEPQHMLAGIEQIQDFKVFTCPIDGTVTRLNKQAYEVALKTETILSIHQASHVHIKGFFDQTDLKYLSEGDLVNLEFADGTESVGMINRFYSATYILPEEFQKKFEPTTRTLAADIIPISTEDLEIWKKYYKLSVTISKRTF